MHQSTHLLPPAILTKSCTGHCCRYHGPLDRCLVSCVLCPMSCVNQPSSESLKKVLDGKVSLMEGAQERSLPGGEAEATFCVSLSKLLHLDEASQ